MRTPWLVLALPACGFADIVEDRVGAVDADLAALEQRLQELEDENALLRERMDALEVDSGVLWIRGDEVWRISGVDQSLESALTAAANMRIWPTGSLTLQLEDGVHAIPSTLDLRHPDGDRIRILGDVDEPDNVVLECADEVCLDVSWGGEIAMIDGMVLVGNGENQGVRTTYDGRVTLGASIEFRDFDIGIVCTTGGVVRGNGVRLMGNRIGAVADAGGMIDLQRPIISSEVLGIGAEPAGMVVTWNATVRGGEIGFKARGGQIWAPRATVDTVQQVGFQAMQGGMILGTSTTVTGSPLAYEAVDGGTLFTGDPTSAGNTRDVLLDNASAAYMPYPAFAETPGSIELRRRSVLVTRGWEGDSDTVEVYEDATAFGP